MMEATGHPFAFPATDAGGPVAGSPSSVAGKERFLEPKGKVPGSKRQEIGNHRKS